MDGDEIRQAMNRQRKPTYRIDVNIQRFGVDEIWVSGKVQNTSVMTGHDISAVLLLPTEFFGTAQWGEEILEQTSYAMLLSDLRGQVIRVVHPFETTEILFKRRMVSAISSVEFTAFIRVYDQFGQAHETEFLISASSMAAVGSFSPLKALKERHWDRE